MSADDEKFCVLPLTHDFEAKPFRIDIKTGRGSQLLLHCILAVCYKHISHDTGSYVQEAKTHKRQALDLLKDVENQANHPVRASFLDAFLILMTLDVGSSRMARCGMDRWTDCGVPVCNVGSRPVDILSAAGS